jgi:hypothetical protein
MADNSYAQLIDDYENGILVEPGETLTQYIDRMGGVDYKADGGSIGIEVLFEPKREEYQTGGRTFDSRATTQDYTNALQSVSAGTTGQQQADARRYARNQATQMLNEAARAKPQARGIENIYNTFFKNQNVTGIGSNTFGRSGSGTNPDALMYYRSADRDKILDAMANQMLNTTQYSQPKINERREKEYADYMNNLIASTYGKADDYKAEAMTLGMPTSAYFDYLTTSDPQDKVFTYDTLSRDPYFDPKTYVPTDYSNPETPRPPSPYETYFQRELQNQINMGIPQGQRIQQGQVLGLPTVLSGGAPGSQMGPGYESYEDVLARNKKMMGLRDGGRVGLFMGGDPLTGQALSIYDSMNSYGFTDQQIANALEAQGLYTPGSTTTTTTTTPVINKALNIINQDGGDGGGGGGPKGSGLGLSRFDYGYTSPGGEFNIDDIAEGTVADEDYTLGMKLGDLGTGIRGGLAKAYNDLRSLPTPFNVASKAIGNISDFAKAQAEKAAAALAAAKARAESRRQYDSSVHGPTNYGLGSDGKQSYDSGQGFGINATTGGPVSNRTGRGRTDYKDGGLATMFKNKR